MHRRRMHYVYMSEHLKNHLSEYSVADLCSGVRLDGETYLCLICGTCFDEGVIYHSEEESVTAALAARRHVANHGGMLRALLDLPRSVSGLSEVQKALLGMFGDGLPDRKVAQKMDKAESTIRNHRFQLRKRIGQAKILAAIGQLLQSSSEEEAGIVARGVARILEKQEQRGAEFVAYHDDIPMKDERIRITVAEAADIAERLFAPDETPRLLRFPRKEKEKLVVLKRIAETFDPAKQYTEKEVNLLIEPIYDDYVTIRRYLVDYRFLDREPDGSRYWRHG
jgi:DNA-binding CsgD family transcriptional regulator